MPDPVPNDTKLPPEIELLVRKLVVQMDDDKAAKLLLNEEQILKRRQINIAIVALFAVTLITSFITATSFWIERIAENTAKITADQRLNSSDIASKREHLESTANIALESALKASTEASQASRNAQQAIEISGNAISDAKLLGEKVSAAQEIVKAAESLQAAQNDLASKLSSSPTFKSDVAKFVGAVPRDAIAFFNRQRPCPDGWKEATELQGRYAVGALSSSTIGRQIGQAFTSDGENRATGWHLHRYSDGLIGGNPARGPRDLKDPDQPIASGNNGVRRTLLNTTYAPVQEENNDTSVNLDSPPRGTNAPYVQLLACRKE